MMDELMKEVSHLVGKEYQRAAAEHGGAANTPHEGYALIKEEVEEAAEEMERLKKKLDFLWLNVKRDDEDMVSRNLDHMKSIAIAGACELIQVAAMTEKATAGIGKKEGGEAE